MENNTLKKKRNVIKKVKIEESTLKNTLNQYIVLTFLYAYIKGKSIKSNTRLSLQDVIPMKRILRIFDEETTLYGLDLMMNDYKKIYSTNDIMEERYYSNYYYIKALNIPSEFIINSTIFNISKKPPMLYLNMKDYMKSINIKYKFLLKKIEKILEEKVLESNEEMAREKSRRKNKRYEIIISVGLINEIFNDENILINKLISVNSFINIIDFDMLKRNEIKKDNEDKNENFLLNNEMNNPLNIDNDKINEMKKDDRISNNQDTFNPLSSGNMCEDLKDKNNYLVNEKNEKMDEDNVLDLIPFPVKKKNNENGTTVINNGTIYNNTNIFK